MVFGTTERRDPGAGEGNRTPDLLLTMEALCRLSYSGGSAMIATGSDRSVARWMR